MVTKHSSSVRMRNGSHRNAGSQRVGLRIVSCTEPFGAVKKLMGEHFDAVAWIATTSRMLRCFLRAHATPRTTNRLWRSRWSKAGGSSEGISDRCEPGLTKPINVEQAKVRYGLRETVAQERIRETQRHLNTATAKPATPRHCVRLESQYSSRVFLHGFGFGRESACSAQRAAAKPVAPPSFAASASRSARVLSPKNPLRKCGAKDCGVDSEPKLEVTSRKKETSAASSAGCRSGLGGRCQCGGSGRE